MSDTGAATPGGGPVTDSDRALSREAGSRASATSGSMASGTASTTTISTIAVQSGNTKVVLALLQSSEWLELRIVELSPGLVHLGTNLEEATAMQQAHLEVLTKLQSKQSPVEDLLNQADQLISTQRPRAEVYAAMAESLGLAWKELNQQLETRKALLDLAVLFQTRARQYGSALDAAEKAYTDNLLPSEVESCRELISALHDHKRSVLEASMYTLQEGQVLLSKLRSLLQEGATMDSRPQHIRISIDFACSQVEHQLEALHDRRRFLDSLFTARRHHLDQCLSLALLYQDLTEAVVLLKALRDEVSSHQSLGESQTQAEVLLHEHQARDARAKSLRDVCIRHVSTAEQMVTSGHYAGVEARSRAYNVLEAATALHETCDTRGALLRQAVLFFKLAQTALTKLEQAEVQLAGGDTDPRRQRLFTVLGVVEEAVQPALHEGYAIIEVTGGRGQPHNTGVCAVVDELERRRQTFSTLCADTTEQDVQRTQLLNEFLELHNTLESWLVRVGDGFLQGHQDPGGSLRLAQDFLHLHLQLISDTQAKDEDLDAIDRFLAEAKQDLSDEEHRSCAQKASKLRDHWRSLIATLEKRISLIEKYVQFLESAEKIQSDLEQLEKLLRGPAAEDAGPLIEETWSAIRGMISDLNDMGAAFIKSAQKVEDPYLDSKRATLSVETILDALNRKQLMVTELHSQYTETIRSTQQMITIWNTYKQNIDSLREEFEVMERQFCPLLRGDVEDPDALAAGLDQRLQAYIAEVKDAQHKIQEMITKAELAGVPNVSSSGARDEVVTGLLQFFQLLQASSTNFQILASMLTQWCRNIAEIHRSCSKFEEEFKGVPPGGSSEAHLKEHHAARQAVHELLRFARSEADGIVAKIRQQCPTEPGREDISKIEELLQRRQQRFEESWTRHLKVLESSVKRSQCEGDLQGIIGQLEELSSQLLRMQGRYGDSLPAALSTRDAFTHFRHTVTLLQERIETFLSNAQRAADAPDDGYRGRPRLADLQNKWSTFYRQVGNTEKNIELSIEFFTHVNEAEDWFRGGSRLLVDVAGESSSVRTPEEAHKLRTRIESFLKEGEPEQQRRITTISTLAADLYGPDRPPQVDALCQQNKYIIESLTVITKNLTSIETNLKMADDYRQKQEQDQQAMAASLVQAQAEADAARQAAAAADEARQLAEEVARKMAQSPVPEKPIQVEIDVQTEAMPLASDDDLPPPPPTDDEHLSKKTKFVDDQPDHMPPVFITPLVGATVQEGVKFSFECRVMGYPVPEVEWFKDNLSITKNPDYKTTLENGVCCLTIEETFAEDSALFTCKAYNASGRDETSATLTVKETEPAEALCPPTFTRRLPPSAVALEGAEHQLEATVTGHPLPVVSWLKNDVCVDESPDYVITYNNGECVLRFEEVFVEDAALYLCRATNTLGQDETSTNMAVTAKSISTLPVFLMPLNNLMARAGQKFKLECQVKGDPLPTVAWFHNGRPVKETPDCKLSFDTDTGTATLLMSEAFPKNGGLYSAVAKNTAGEAQCTATVSVKGRIPTETSDSELPSDADVELVKPSVQLALRDTTMVEGGTTRLDCVIVGQPEPEVIWYHDDKPVKESTDFKLLFHGDRCSLVITEAYPEDAGTYKVVARNSAGEASTACFLSVQPAPEPEPPAPQEPAVAPRFTSLLADSHVIEGGAVTLRTSVSGSPLPDIAWFRDGEPLVPDHGLLIQQDGAGNASVMIPKAAFEHTGQYEVVASNCAGTAKCIAFLSIEQRLPTPPAREPDSPPVFTRLLNDVLLTSGESITFEVDVKGSPKPVVEWYLNEGRITGQEYMRDARQYLVGEEGGAAGGGWRHWLTVPSVGRLQEGRLRVQAENTAGRAVVESNVRVVEPASLKVAMPEVTKEEVITSSSTTSFSHTSHSSSSSTYIKKVFTSTSDGPDETSTRATSSHATSVISKVGEEPVVQMHGRHDAQFRKDHGAPPVIQDKSSFMKMTGSVVTDEVSQERTVQGALPAGPPRSVEGPPTATTRSPAIKKKTTPARFVTPLQGLIVKEDDRVVFECVIDGYPEPTVSWSHNGGPVDPACQTSVCLNRVCLVVPRVGQAHSGRYTCSIDNEAGSSHCTCDLVVKKTQFPPVFCKRLQPAVLGVGERLALEVDVTGTPEPEVSWSRNGVPLQPSDRVTIRQEGTRHLLIIQKGELGDSARYGVVASNPAGRAECLADIMITELIMQQAPQIPSSILFADQAHPVQQNETQRSGRGLVKSITRAIEEVAVESDPPFPVSKKPFIVKPSLQPQPVPDQPFLPPETSNRQPSVPVEDVYEVEQRKPPGKLKKAWPPPPPEEEIVSYRIDPSSEVMERKVSSIISTFSELESPSEPVPLKAKPPGKIWQPSLGPDFIEADFELQPEPEPQFGVVPPTQEEPPVEPGPQFSVAPSAQEELPLEPEPQFSVAPSTQEELPPEPEPQFEAALPPAQELLPGAAPQFEVASGDEEFEEMESFESGEVIMHEPVIAKESYSDAANMIPILEAEEEPMEVDTAGEEYHIPEPKDNFQFIKKEVEETSEMEVKRTYEESEYKIVETKVFRSEERDSADQEEFQDAVPEPPKYAEPIICTQEQSPVREPIRDETMEDLEAREVSSQVVSDRSYEAKEDEYATSGIASRSLSKTPARVVSEEEDEPEEAIPFEFVSQAQHVESETDVPEELGASVTVSDAPKAVDEQPWQPSDTVAYDEIISSNVSYQQEESVKDSTARIFPMDDTVATEVVDETHPPQTEYNIIQSPEPVVLEVKSEYIDREMPEVISAFATVVEPVVEQEPPAEVIIDELPVTHEPEAVPDFEPSYDNAPPKFNSFEKHDESISMSSSRFESHSYSSSTVEKSSSSFVPADASVPTSLPQSSHTSSHEQHRSGDEMSKPPRPPEAEEREVRRPRKVRESVKQLAMRLEDTIVPLSPDEVPGGIRMFPTPSPTKDLSQPFKKVKPEEKPVDEEKKIEVTEKEEKPKQFPELEPFPFTVEERKPKERTQSVPPLSKPKKFVPGAFTDSEHESETDSSISSSGKRLILKKIEFNVPIKDKPLRTASVGRDPLPPSAFDVPLAFDGSMRPQVVKQETKTVEKKAEPGETPSQSAKKKQPSVVTKFMKSAENLVQSTTSTEPKSKVAEAKAPAVSPSVLTAVQSKTIREERSFRSKSYHEVSVEKPEVQQQAPENVPQRLPAKLGKQWPPPQEPRVFSPTADDIAFLKKIGSEEEGTVSYSASSQQSFTQSLSSSMNVQSSEPQVSSVTAQSPQHVLSFSPPVDTAPGIMQSPQPTVPQAQGLVSPPVGPSPVPSAATPVQAKSPVASVCSPPPPRVFSPVSTRLVSSSNEYLASSTSQFLPGSPSQVLSPPPAVSWPPVRPVSPEVGKLTSPVRTMSPIRIDSPQIRAKSPAAAPVLQPAQILSTKVDVPQGPSVLEEDVSQPTAPPSATGFRSVAAPVSKRSFPTQKGPTESIKPSFPFASERGGGSTFIRESQSMSQSSCFQQQTSSSFRSVQQQKTQDIPKESSFNRSLSLERPPVTEPVSVPTTSFEAPPVMWSSNVTVKEKRSSWPAPQPSVTSAFSEENIHSQSKREFWKSQESKFSSSQIVAPKPTPVYKAAPKTQSTSVPSRTVKATPTAAAPTPEPVKEIPKQDTIGSYKPIPNLEPFPFSVPESTREQPVRRQATSLRMPKKFVPGSFTESEYESDYDVNFSPKWRPCASDSESIQYKKLNVNLRGGRSRSTLRASSPPPPSQFDVPPPSGGPLRPTVPRLLDSDSDTRGISTRAASVPKHRPVSMDASNLNKDFGKSQAQHFKGSVPSIPSALASSTPPSYKPMRTQWPSHTPPKRQSNVVHVRNISYSTSAFSPVTPSLSTQYSAMSTPNLHRQVSSQQHRTPKTTLTDSEPSRSNIATKIASSDTFDASYKKVSTQSHTIPQAFSQISSEVKQTSPGTKKKQQHDNANRQFELEDGGYIADTESTLPRRNVKAQSSSESVSSSFMKKESHTSSSTFKSERKSYSSSSTSRGAHQESAFPAARPGFGEDSNAAVFQTTIPSPFTSLGTNPFPQASSPASSLKQSTQQQSSSFFSSESKSSQVFTSKTEERTQRRAQETTDDESPHPGASRDQQQPKKPLQTHHKPQHKPRSPKHTREEKFTKSSYQKGPGHSPYCEDTYYSKRDESDDSTDTSRTHRKIEVRSETHTEMMSSKKSETYRMSSSSPSRSQDSTKPTKPKEKDVTRGDFHVIERKIQGPKDVAAMPDFEHVIESSASPRVLQPKPVQSRPEPSTSRPVQSVPVFQPKLKSTQLVRDVQIDVDKREMHLEDFPFEVEPARERKPRGPPPPTPRKFVRGEFRESDYDSEMDDKVRPKWIPSAEQDAKELSYTRVEPTLFHREPVPKERTPTPPSQFDTPPKFEGPPRPKVEFPDSESEVEKPTQPAVTHRPKVMKRIPKTIQPAYQSPPPKEKSPELQPEPVAEEGYIPPAPPPISYHSDSLGVESTKITTISDTSQFHRRFITQQQTTRVFKLSDMKVTTPPQPQVVVPKKETEIEIKMSPINVNAPPPEALPFTPFPGKERKEKAVPLVKPSKFRKGDFRESDYESEDDTKIRPKWQPPDSDADEPSYNKVQPPRPSQKAHSRSRERSPTPPSSFDVPPKTGEPLRPPMETAAQTLPVKAPKATLGSPKKKVMISPKHVAAPRQPSNLDQSYLTSSDDTPQISFVTQVEVKSRSAPPPTKEVPSYEARPYTEVIEKTEKIFTKKNVVEEVKRQHTRKETVTTTKQESDVEQPATTMNGYHVTVEREEPSSQLEEFPFKPSPPRPKRVRGTPPPAPKVFVKGEFSESEYDSEYDGRIKTIWNPSDSESDNFRYKKVVPPSPSRPRQVVEKERTPTPPSKFDVPPVQGGPLRPEIRMLEKVVIGPLGSSPHPAGEQRSPALEPLSQSRGAPQRKNTFVIEENFKVTMNKSEDDYYTVTESDYTDSDVCRQPPQPQRSPQQMSSKPPSASPSHESVFLKGGVPASPGRIHRNKQIWPPKYVEIQNGTDQSDLEKPPVAEFPKPGIQGHLQKPTKPFFLNNRERRESLDDVSAPKFPQVEFKPYPSPAVNGTAAPGPARAEKYVSGQLADMTQTFRMKAQNFAEKLVGEVFAAKDGAEPPEPAGDPPSLPSELKTADVKSEIAPQEPQVYRDDSRASEFGTKHIDPDSGLIYFKYDFGYEFGILLPGQGQPVDKQAASKDAEDSVPFPILHTKASDGPKAPKAPKASTFKASA